MKIKLDENLPASLVALLTSLGHDTDSTLSEDLDGADDDAVWEAAQAAGRFLITQDLDFSDARRFAPGTHHGLMLVRLRSPGRLALAQRIEQVFRTERVDAWKGCVIVTTDRKVRVRQKSV